MRDGTITERRADDFDCDLYRLICRAGSYACKDQSRDGGDRQRWANIESDLRGLRWRVREMMNAKQRAATS